jgi:hypothetical protein
MVATTTIMGVSTIEVCIHPHPNGKSLPLWLENVRIYSFYFYVSEIFVVCRVNMRFLCKCDNFYGCTWWEGHVNTFFRDFIYHLVLEHESMLILKLYMFFMGECIIC